MPKPARNPFHVIAGTSAGALNAASLATHAHHLRTAVRILENIWKNISSDMVYDLHSANLLAGASGLVLNMLSGKNSDNAVALLNNAPLADLLARVIKFDRIQHNIDIGLLDALSITASAYGSGESVSFYQGIKNIENWQGPHRIGVRTDLGLKHLMASAAIPVIFPAVKLGA
ncbi:MAG: patatin-like phospholipase family protein [Pseudomonadales bacterium]|nr:patatin-like phospholipase family protein [Pseudomonadales bacterium]